MNTVSSMETLLSQLLHESLARISAKLDAMIADTLDNSNRLIGLADGLVAVDNSNRLVGLADGLVAEMSAHHAETTTRRVDGKLENLRNLQKNTGATETSDSTHFRHHALNIRIQCVHSFAKTRDVPVRSTPDLGRHLF